MIYIIVNILYAYKPIKLTASRYRLHLYHHIYINQTQITFYLQATIIETKLQANFLLCNTIKKLFFHIKRVPENKPQLCVQ